MSFLVTEGVAVETRYHIGMMSHELHTFATVLLPPTRMVHLIRVTVLALRLSDAGQMPVPITTWSHKAELIFVDCLALVGHPVWRARCFVHSAAEPAFVPFPREVLNAGSLASRERPRWPKSSRSRRKNRASLVPGNVDIPTPVDH